MSQKIPAVRWYAGCRAYFAVPEPLRRRFSRQTVCHFRRITRLPRELGEDLDGRFAPLAIVSWVAWGDDDAEKRARHAAVVEHRARTGVWPDAKVRSQGPPPTPRAA